jgi:Flp pilus assembly protein TadD
MPRTGARNVLHVAWTDHRIRKQPGNASAAPESRDTDDLVPIFSPTASRRDLAMANYQALLEGDRSREQVVWEQLSALGEELKDDREGLDALGNVSAERGDHVTAERVFRRVLEIDPNDLTALSNLGTLLAKGGKLKESLVMLEKAFERNQDIPSLAKNLARVQCMAGDGPAARNTLATAVLYCPNVEDVRVLLTQMGNCDAAGAP